MGPSVGRRRSRLPTPIPPLLSLMVLVMLALPEYGFTRGLATAPGQIQYVACPYFPDCYSKPRKYWGESRLTRCREHNVLMDAAVVWKRYG